jgi:predicted RNA binding protein YcfA (HicA-like mRNA interferase family)
MMRSISYRELVKILKANGAFLVRVKGSHEVWRAGECQTVVPHHPTIASGTLRNIRNQMAPCLGEDWLDQ